MRISSIALFGLIAGLASTALGCTEGRRPLADTRSKEERYADVAQPISIPSGVYKYCSAQKFSAWSFRGRFREQRSV